MKPLLSIIIPCYNCEKTLEESINSCYTQGLGESFEIVMVDDGSTDSTYKLMEVLLERNKNIRIFKHEKNKGGGATRNTAVENSKADIIFCLDSDDILPKETLSKMLNYLNKKNCDGVAIEKSTKFYFKNLNKILFINSFGYSDKKIPLESLFSDVEGELCPLYSTFMFTKKSFNICGGYPTNHEFDTQGFAFRYLINGQNIYTCPGTTYMHRFGDKTYTYRTYEFGKQNYNWLKIFEEFLYIFSDKTKNIILNYKPNTQSNLLNDIKKSNDIINKNIISYIKPYSKEEYVKDIIKKSKINKFETYYLGIYFYNKNKTNEALNWLIKSLESGLQSTHLYYKIVDCISILSNNNKDQLLKSLLDYNKTIKTGRQASIYQKIIRRLKKII